MEEPNQNLYSLMQEVEKFEGEDNKFSNTFTDMFKNEIDATDEQEVYNNLRNLIYKYKDDKNSMKIIDEFTEAITDGATLSEILTIARDEIDIITPINAMDLDEFSNYEQ